MASTTSVVALSGNPRQGSRTRIVAEQVARAVAALVGGEQVEVVDLSEIAEEIFASTRPRVDAARELVARSRVLVVATPTYKATYTGLLKSFLDLYGSNGLAGVIAVPVQVAGNPVHLLAAEVHLRPLLVELGAQVPSRALVLTEAQLGDLDGTISAWLATEAHTLQSAVRGAEAGRTTAPEPVA